MSIAEFELIVTKHSLQPDNYLFNSNALTGEAGEVANQVKKREMALLRPEWVTQNENRLPSVSEFEDEIKKELGDVLFYLVRLALDNGLSLESIMFSQAVKLRKQSSQYGRTFLK
jgi:NTP pyrophosphatase (non-canonical NTP hydrolase)